MCIALLTTAHPDYPYILLSNRDEFLNRPTALAQWWDAPNQHVLGGRDLQRKEHGTWLAITKQGRLAVLTNFREDGVEVTKDKSRGGIVNAFLTVPPGTHESPRDFASRLINEVGVHDVGGFSLVFGDLKAPSEDGQRPGLSILSNRSASADNLTRIATQSGEVHGLSNSHFGDLTWPKVVHGEQLLKQAVHSHVKRGESQHDLIESCFEILSIDTLPKREKDQDWTTYTRQMRNSILIPPVGGEATEKRSADQLASAESNETTASKEPALTNGHNRDGYGTHKQTVVLVDRDGRVTFVERTLFDEDGRPVTGEDRERRFEFVIEGWKS